jgi:hypothetical protein
MFINECIDSTVSHIHMFFDVLLASDDPRTSWFFSDCCILVGLPQVADQFRQSPVLQVVCRCAFGGLLLTKFCHCSYCLNS